MSNDLHISIATPCTESWEQMSPVAQGRFCSSCNKAVVNFAAMTDRQVFDWLASHSGPTCGRFHEEQLNRPLLRQPTKTPAPIRYWHYLVALLLSSTELVAQSQSARPLTTQQFPTNGEGRFLTGDTVMTPEPASPPALLKGQILDADGRPVSFASVRYEEHKGVAADAEGRFSIPWATLAGVRTLSISAVGYQSLQVNLDKLQKKNISFIPVKLQMHVMVMGDLVTVVRHRRKKTVADTLTAIRDTIAACLNLRKNDFSVYPNPVPRGNPVTITARPEKSGTYAIQLFSISGELLHSTTAGSEQLSGAFPFNLPLSVPSGTYIIRLFQPGAGKDYTRQIIVL
jgi:hypothetical protein